MVYYKTIFLLIFVAELTLISTQTRAARHIIKFGGSLGYDYSPESVTVNVGDTILWVGDFSKHPLSLIKVPGGAAKFSHITSGSTYQYVVTTPGAYEYQCDKHIDEGMEGSFNAVARAAKFEQTP